MQRTMVATTEGNASSPVYQPRKGPYCLIGLGYGEGSNNQNHERVLPRPGHEAACYSFTDTFSWGWHHVKTKASFL